MTLDAFSGLLITVITVLGGVVAKLYYSGKAASEKAELLALATLSRVEAEKVALALTCATELAVERKKRDDECREWQAKLEAKSQEIIDIFRQAVAMPDRRNHGTETANGGATHDAPSGGGSHD